MSQLVDLGITVSDNMSWANHISRLVKKLRQRLGFVKRVLGHDISTNVKKLCYSPSETHS